MKAKQIILALLLLLPCTASMAHASYSTENNVQWQAASDDKRPLIIVNDKIFNWAPDDPALTIEDLEDDKWLATILGISVDQIKRIKFLDAAKGKEQWGQKGANGVVLVTTTVEPIDDDDNDDSKTDTGTKTDTTTVTPTGNITFFFTGNDIVDANNKSLTTLVKPMQKNIALLLSKANKACKEKRPINFEGINIEERASKMFAALWNAHPFTCDESTYMQPALCDVRGFQVRDIAITEKANDDSDRKENIDRQLCISFNADGVITGINFAMASSEYKFTKKNPNVTDKRRELEILQFIEMVRVLYINHDIDALRNLFSDDAIIITGKVTMKPVPNSEDGKRYKTQIKYRKQDKATYIKNLANTFKNNPFIDVKFDDIKLSQHPTRPNVYGVNLVQTWNSRSHSGSEYNDVGHLHLLFDFPDHDDPRIHVRAWQPLTTPEGEIITIDSYDD